MRKKHWVIVQIAIPLYKNLLESGGVYHKRRPPLQKKTSLSVERARPPHFSINKDLSQKRSFASPRAVVKLLNQASQIPTPQLIN